MAKPTILVKRSYEKAQKSDGVRVLVDRIWPRGVSKEDAKIEEWAKDLAPTTELRKWFGHKPELWPEFQKKYFAEMKKNEAIESFIEAHKSDKVLSLIYSAKDEEHNQALVLQKFLDEHF
ncbi:MAG: DUF488 family protein [Chitinophagaceae bacterium]